ncbi:transcriptional regulator [Lacticaseibacillus paracasei subsp. tolerans]|uniref:helix-turn-helix transcriptional regulator n=1 Tax=Lacticaseibacillus paracasei TaxID=1597 RepID=UPI00070F9CC5|nr:helix-turn-helix transcriptional regulator [Lacticaseibacillus paracasei]MBU6047706.1 helix-turn-helix transcriptional regulator [Lacticaseibacillus paracasei]MCL4972530.1 helix-turn-helix transcriptional regulator [Lacticaseibacillus paracasei]MCT3364314.1 transcriptional regulator [Lacticaseibacillus paracasei]GEL38965.1 transcriptional regulator [Lacticaseibacillus paracasei subsp. tolerans]
MENNIHALRTHQQLTQQELADAVNVTRQTINAIENNKYDPTLSLAFALAERLETNVDQLFQH